MWRKIRVEGEGGREVCQEGKGLLVSQGEGRKSRNGGGKCVPGGGKKEEVVVGGDKGASMGEGRGQAGRREEVEAGCIRRGEGGGGQFADEGA